MKKTYTITTKETSTILVQNNAIEQIDRILVEKNYSSFLVITDQTTKQLFAKNLTEVLKKLGKPIEIYVLPIGEQSKLEKHLFQILEDLVERGFDRKSAVIALGGGMVGDMATTVAGLYHRGIDCIQIPTTLLSQIDAAIGGKGAVNLQNYKNIVGITRQPRFIFVDPTLLKSLPKDQIRSGMGEVVKYAIAQDTNLFALLEKNKMDVTKQFTKIIKLCIQAKMNIVQKDPYELSGDRQILNFGHTLGHAIELYANLAHGDAVSIGMVFATIVSEKLGMIDKVLVDKVITLLKKYQLPTSLNKKNITKEIIFEHMQKDKKAIDGIPTFVLLEGLGKAKAGCRVSKEIIDETLDEVIL